MGPSPSRTIAVLGVLMLESCTLPKAFTCDADAQCGGEGQCVAGGCAFPDEDCESGLRYGALSALAGECVGDEPVAEGSASSGSETASSGSETGSPGTDTESGSEESSESETQGSETETGDTQMPDPPELLAHYTLDIEDVVGLVVLDSSGNELHALGLDVQPQPPGVVGDCFEFQELSGVDIPVEVVEGLEAFTFECYVRLAPDASGVLDSLLYYGDPNPPLSPPGLSLYFGLNDAPQGSARLFWSDGVDQLTLTGTSDFTLESQWHHLAITAGPKGMQLYVDHELEAEDALTPDLLDPGLLGLYLGSLPGLFPGFEGFLDELRFYDRALSPDEMMPLPPP